MAQSPENLADTADVPATAEDVQCICCVMRNAQYARATHPAHYLVRLHEFIQGEPEDRQLAHLALSDKLDDADA